MTRKDYVRLAAALARNRTEPASLTWLNIIDSICTELQADNPRFDRVRFLEACYA